MREKINASKLRMIGHFARFESKKELYFVDGMILGSESFVKEQLGKDPSGKPEPKAHPMEGGDWKGLAVAKGIRKKLFG